MRNLVCLAFIILFASCSKPTSRNNEITNVELATGACFGPCPVTVISIDNALNFKFYGGMHTAKKGYYAGKITPEIWDSINIKLESIEYKNLRIKYSPAPDDQTLELIVHYKTNKVKRVLATSFGLALTNSNNVAKVFYWISDIYKSVNLEPVKAPIKFETTYHNLPKSNINHLNFPPLIKTAH